MKDGLERHHEGLSVLMAGDGLVAMEKLKINRIDLVVADLKMPRMDGLTLTRRLSEEFPDIPVIIITAYSTPETERLAREGGAVTYIGKPFMVEDLAREIRKWLEMETDGGTLTNVSSGMFLQLMEMEERTCTIRLAEMKSGKRGVLFFRKGELLDARINGLKGEEAAYEIFSWDEVSIAIQNACRVKVRRLHNDLQAILLEAMRLKDEKTHTAKQVPKEKAKDSQSVIRRDNKPLTYMDQIRSTLRAALGERNGLEDIYRDNNWDGLLVEIARLGTFFDAGEFMVGYVNMGKPHDFVLLPGKETTVLTVNRNSPRDRLIEVLSTPSLTRSPEKPGGEHNESPI